MPRGQHAWSPRGGVSSPWSHGQRVWESPILREQSRALEQQAGNLQSPRTGVSYRFGQDGANRPWQSKDMEFEV